MVPGLGGAALQPADGLVEATGVLKDLRRPAQSIVISDLGGALVEVDGWPCWIGCWPIPGLLAPIQQAWEQTARGHGRPTIPMGSFVRLMVVKQRTGWGYETLVREVSDSLHLRRFCLLPLTQRVPDES
jgi:hypothetical protein